MFALQRKKEKNENSSSHKSSTSGHVLSSKTPIKRKTPEEIAELYEKRISSQNSSSSTIKNDYKYESQEKISDPFTYSKKDDGNDLEPKQEKRKYIENKKGSDNINIDKSVSNNNNKKENNIDDPVIDLALDEADEKKSSDIKQKKRRLIQKDDDEEDDKNDSKFEPTTKKQKTSTNSIQNFLSTSTTSTTMKKSGVIVTKSNDSKQKSSAHIGSDGAMVTTSSNNGKGNDLFIAKYNKMSIGELKDILRANSQPLSGTKQDLVERCIDGEKNGRFPRCPTCIKGILHFDTKKNSILCNGYFDTDINARISCKFSAGTIQRLPWLLTSDSSSSSNENEKNSSKKSNGECKLKVEDIAKIIELKKVSAKEAASYILKKAKEFKLSLPSDDLQARLAIGGILMVAPDVNGNLDPQAVMNEIAEKYPSKETQNDSIPQAKCPENSALANMFDELAKKEKNSGAEFAMFKAKAAKQAAISIRDLDFIVTSGKALAQGKNKVPGIGKGSGILIDEFLQTGTCSRLNDL